MALAAHHSFQGVPQHGAVPTSPYFGNTPPHVGHMPLSPPGPQSCAAPLSPSLYATREPADFFPPPRQPVQPPGQMPPDSWQCSQCGRTNSTLWHPSCPKCFPAAGQGKGGTQAGQAYSPIKGGHRAEAKGGQFPTFGDRSGASGGVPGMPPSYEQVVAWAARWGMLGNPPGDVSAPTEGTSSAPATPDAARERKPKGRDRRQAERPLDRRPEATAAPAPAQGTPASSPHSGTSGGAGAPSPFRPIKELHAAVSKPIFGGDSHARQSPFREADEAHVSKALEAQLNLDEIYAQCPVLTPEEAHAHPSWLFPPADPERLPEHRKALTMCRDALTLQLKASQLLGHSDRRIIEIRKEIALANFQLANARDPRDKLADQENIVAQLQRNFTQLSAKQLETEEAARSLALAAQSAQMDLEQANTLLTYFRAQVPTAPALCDAPMLAHQFPFQQGSVQRSATAASMPPAQTPLVSEAPVIERNCNCCFHSPPMPASAPPPEQPFIQSLTTAMQSNADTMAREVANIQASFEAQARSMKESVGSLVSQIQAGQLGSAVNTPAHAAPGGGRTKCARQY